MVTADVTIALLRLIAFGTSEPFDLCRSRDDLLDT